MRRDVAALGTRRFDLLVVGGGIHGAWIALRAARAGLSVALLERGDFGSGTSANSLKILHGGLRYLQDLDFPRMRASIRARREFARLSPRLFEPLRCLMPLRARGLRSPWFLGPALLLNDAVSADRNRGVPSMAALPAGRLRSASATRREVGILADRDCIAGAQWWDGIARDSARLTLDALQAAYEQGAVVANHVEVDTISVDATRRVQGVRARDLRSATQIDVAARVVVNATGPWAPWLSRRSGLPWPASAPAFIGGLNLVLGRRVGPSCAVALTSAGEPAREAAREFFFVPWRDRTLVGTDYCEVPQDVPPSPFAPADAVARFVERVVRLAPRADLTAADVALVHWGLLPAQAANARLPARKPYLAAGRAVTGAEGLVHVVAEKLTSAPMLSAQVLSLAVGAGAVRSRGRTGSTVVDTDVSGDLQDPSAPLFPGSDVCRIAVLHAIREEMACTLADILVRRLGLGDAGRPPDAAIAACAAIAARELSWNTVRVERERQELDDWYRANLSAVR
jgi:glycerol-3-phosphate dehydrogenase